MRTRAIDAPLLRRAATIAAGDIGTLIAVALIRTGGDGPGAIALLQTPGLTARSEGAVDPRAVAVQAITDAITMVSPGP